MARKKYASLVRIMFGVFLALSLGACSTGSGPGPGPTPESTPTIESILNATDPGVSVRSGDWILIAGSSFGAAQDGGSVTFLLENTPLPAASYYLWNDDAIYCQIPVWLTESGGVVGEDLAVTVTTGAGLVSNAIVIPMDETPNPAPTPAPPLIRKRPYIVYENDKPKLINKKLILHRKGDRLKNSHFSFNDPSYKATIINRAMEMDSKARLHNKPHHIRAMDKGMMVLFIYNLAVCKNKIFMMASIHRN